MRTAGRWPASARSGLTGELRSVGHADRRVAEAVKFGLGPVLAPGGRRARLAGVEPQRDASRAAISAALSQPQGVASSRSSLTDPA